MEYAGWDVSKEDRHFYVKDGRGRVLVAGKAVTAPQPLVLQPLLDLGRATGAVGPNIRGGVVIIEDLIRHLTVVHRGIAHVMVTHQLVTAVDVDVVLVAVMALAVFPVQRASQSFRRSLAGFSFHASGVSPALMVAFSSRLLRYLGTGTIDASMICPPIAK